ncbi:LuxR C-terminal-related transcriptional regulator [Microbulbifer rhizosphaerae]|uniref:LuxR family maltose regulon positive regulatory protein n=1 Tax=Microbulbifer rhizosphaerae TaxID=1562603 RepID=A0A7W4WGV6_9GAMM|nr:LuxR C-terminal-related transcriptional regulator [Microbulbifer rhizosphaerae]MBB3063532.1 LuxR family maltose regulon positive regulatory protein [Microbulbifer rhizosphaerae]
MPASSENRFGSTPMIALGLTPPHLVEDSVLRERLLQKACGEQLPAAHLCLVTAPAGYGKSTFLAQCRQRLQDRGLATAWLTLDEEDNEEGLFFYCLGAAFGQFNPAVTGELVERRLTAGEFSGRHLITELLGFLDTSQHYALFLDDYHHIHNPAVHEALRLLLLHLPGNLYLFIGSRSMPPVPLSRYSAAGDLLLLDSGDLGFDREETRALLCDVNHLQVSGEEMALLCESTGGWAAVLQLAALSMQGSADRSRLVSALSANSGSVADFLTEEVVAQMPGTLAGFLRRIAILDRFCASLCLAVTGDREHSFELARLQDSRLPVQSLDESGDWYRLHPLFRNALVRQLESTRAEDLVGLHRRASTWFEKHGLMAEAIQHSISAGDEGRALELLDEEGISLLVQGYVSRFLGLVRRLPESLLRESQGTLIQLAWLQVLCNRLAQARRLLEELKSRRYSLEPAQWVEVNCIEANLYAYDDQLDKAAQLTDTWLPRCPPEPVYLRDCFRLLPGMLHYVRREYAQVLEIAREVLAAPTVPKQVYNQAWAACLAALVYLAGARLKEGIGYVEQQLDNILRHVMPNSEGVALLESMTGLLCYQRGELQRAETLFQRGLEALRVYATVDMVIGVLSARARLLHGAGDTQGALDYLDEMQALAEERGWTRLRACVVHERVRLLLALGELGRARACFDEWQHHWEILPRPSGYTQANIEEWIGVAEVRLILAEGDAVKAAVLLKALIGESVENDQVLRAMELQVLLAKTYLSENKPDQAKQALMDALALDPESGAIQLFRDEGEAVIAALTALRQDPGLSAGPEPGELWQQQIDTIITPDQTAGEAKPDPAGAGFGELSKMELAILALVVEGYSNKEISERLVVPIDTVKTHLKSAYGKLGVSRRTQAVRRLLQLGIFE